MRPAMRCRKSWEKKFRTLPTERHLAPTVGSAPSQADNPLLVFSMLTSCDLPQNLGEIASGENRDEKLSTLVRCLLREKAILHLPAAPKTCFAVK